MPSKILLAAAPGWQIGAALGLTLAAIAVFAVVGGRIFRTAVLRPMRT
jgi:hypothetical protein